MKKLLFLIGISVITAASFFAQSNSEYEFISPKPGSDFNTMESTVSIRYGSYIDVSSLSENLLLVHGNKSGKIFGELKLSTDQKTIIFKPFNNFKPGEKVNVTLMPGIKSRSGDFIPETTFSFLVAPFSKTPNPYEIIEELKPNYGMTKKSANKSNSILKDFPTINVDMYDEEALEEGYIFLAVAAEVENVGYYLMMLNNDGTPFWSRELLDDYAYDFKMQPNGQVTYAQFLEHHSYTGGGNVIHKVLDYTLNEVDEVQMGNGYIAEAHDFQILPNGHYLLIGYYLTQADLSDLVDGGYPNALVSGGIVQELDSEKNVVFQWRSWDHYDFATYDWGPRSNRPIVSTFHLNTIVLDTDNNIIIATPSWVKKINRQNSEIMWRLGDFDNEYTFINCDEGYVGGHMFHRIYDNHFLIYDNGNRQGTTSSKVHELIVDEENKTCELFWTFEPDSAVAGWHRGNAQRLPNGNTVIGWGGSSGKYSPTFTEVNELGEVLMELFFDPFDVESYRAFRFPFNAGGPLAEVTETEVANGNTYDFIDEDTGDTGISIKINNREGDGYNELIVTKYGYAPLDPQFPWKAPQVLPRRFVLSQQGITAIDADINFDTEIWRINDPGNTIIYHREFENTGLFVPLAGEYNPVTNKIKVNTTRFGEFIITAEDLESLTLPPMPYSPKNETTVNQELPVLLEWNPIGYANTYSLQVASDINFTNLVVDETGFPEAIYHIGILEDETDYFWRIKSTNDAGESEWCDIHKFTTVPPFINIIAPVGGEQWQVGIEKFIEWSDNIEEDVIISLLNNKNETVIDTVISDRAYLWEIDFNLPLSDNYKIEIKSLTDGSTFSESPGTFSLIDSVSSVSDENMISEYKLFQNYPNPFNPSTEIKFAIPTNSRIKLLVYDILGNEIKTLLSGVKAAGTYTVKFDASDLTSGIYLYKLEADNFLSTKKMLLIK